MTAPAFDPAFDRARQLFEQALLLLQQGQAQQAETQLLACLDIMPARVSPLVALGAARLRQGRADDALQPLQQALDQDSSRSDAWGHLADALLQLGRPAEALQALDQADPQDPATAWHRAQAHNGLGQHQLALPLIETLLTRSDATAMLWLDFGRTLQCLQRHEEAGPAYLRAVQQDPQLGEAWSLRGQWLHDQGQPAAAQQAFEQALALGHDPELNRWMLSAARDGSADRPTPPQPPEHYVRLLFDGYAADFDQHLVQALRYEAPAQLETLLAAHPPRCNGTALDLGCGTGLCGALLQRWATAVDGVDLSPAMLERARALGPYRHLHQDEVLRHLQTTTERHAVLLAADLLIYMGDLQALFAAARRVLQPGGVFALTAEAAAEDTPFELRTSRRYAHGEQALRRWAAQAQFEVTTVQRGPLRLHEGQPMEGLYMLLTTTGQGALAVPSR